MKKKIIEKYDWSAHINPVGVDEVGRGCLAGPVYAAAVILGPNAPYELFTDSKLLSEKRRKEISDIVFETCDVGIGFATVKEIDEINILKASLLAMERAVQKLPEKFQKSVILVDGRDKIPGLKNREQIPLIKGDLRAAPIGAASIVAKVARDSLMKELDEKYPGYGFADHKGYSTAIHMQSIAKLKPTPVHRATFRGVKEYLL